MNALIKKSLSASLVRPLLPRRIRPISNSRIVSGFSISHSSFLESIQRTLSELEVRHRDPCQCEGEPRGRVSIYNRECINIIRCILYMACILLLYA